MKKYFAFVVLLVEMLVLFSTGVSATEDVWFSLSADDNIKTGQSFNICISAESNTDIGVFRISVEFDDELLSFKSARLSDEYKDHYMRYENHGNRVIIIYMNDTQYPLKSLKNAIKLRFSPLNNIDENYTFRTSLYEAGDNDANPLECYEMPALSLNVSQNGSSSDTSYSKVSSVYNGEIPGNKASKLNSDKKTENSGNSALPQDSQNISSVSFPENHEYSLSENDTDISFKQDYFYFIAGAVILVAVVAVTAFKLGAKNKYSDGSEKNEKNEK